MIWLERKDRVPRYRTITTLGQDSHRFAKPGADTAKTDCLVLGGIHIQEAPPLAGNSDADVMLHALTNAISGYTGKIVLGGVADELCRQGVTDSAAYLKCALADLPTDCRIVHVSFSIEGKRPKLKSYLEEIKANIGQLIHLPPQRVGITATTGEGLTAFGLGEGLQVLCLLTIEEICGE